MEREKLLKADYLDIIFDHRNKDYGGYELRKNYSRRTRSASSIVLFTAAVGFAIPALAGMLKKPESGLKMPRKQDNGIIYAPTPTPPPKPIPVQIQPPVSHANIEQIVFNPPAIIRDDQVRPNETLTQNDKLHDKQIGDENHTGDVATGSISLPTGPGPVGDGLGGTGEVESGTGKSDKPFTYVEQMPLFNGDMTAYLNSHIQYPEAAREANAEGRVVVQFIVNEDGSVSNATVIRSASPYLDNEALRVVNSMPHWKPGKQNGIPVKVYFTLPVSFVLNN